MKKKISIITVVKNGMPFLRSSIKSFELQNYNNKELIIIYAKSNDGTEEYLKSLNHSNIFIKEDLNSKTKFGSINIGLKISSGEIVGLLHSDDVFYSENTLSEIVYKFDNDADLIYGNVLFSKVNDLSSINRIWKSKIFIKKNLRFGWMPPHTSIFLVKKKLIDNNIFYNEDYPISGDYDFILKILSEYNFKVEFIDNFITIMRSGGDSTKISNLIKKFKEDIEISKKYFKSYLICIFFKIFQKIFQLKFINTKIKNDYINTLNNLK